MFEDAEMFEIFANFSLIKILVVVGIIIIPLFLIIGSLLVLRPKKYKVTSKGKEFAKEFKLFPSNGVYMRGRNPSKFLSKSFFSDYSSRKRNDISEESKILGRRGEKYFASKNKWARPEVPLTNATWKGRADFIDKYNIYEIKTTRRVSYGDRYNDKWMFQLAIYLSMSGTHTKGRLIVYQVEARSIKEKYRKNIELKDYQPAIKEIEKNVTAWRQKIIDKGIISYKPPSIAEGIRIWVFNRLPAGSETKGFIDKE